jgi:hypothetical protein
MPPTVWHMRNPMPSEKKRIMDVSKPGKTAATATTRPIIVGHGPIMKDPMMQQPKVAAVNEEGEPIKKPAPAQPPNKLVLKPMVAGASADEKSSTAKASDATTDESGADGETPADSQDEAVVDAVVSQAVKDKRGEQQAKEDTERAIARQKLIDEKKYFLPIGQTARRRNRWAWFILLFLIVAAATVYMLLDANVIKNNVALPFEFFKEKEAAATSVAPVAKTTPTPTPVTKSPTDASMNSFTNASLGLSFAYPESWGTAKVTTEKGSISGTHATITFSKKLTVGAGLLSKDYKENGRDGSCYVLLGIFPETTFAQLLSYVKEGDAASNTAEYKRTVRILDSAADRLVYEQFEAGQPGGLGACPGASDVGYKMAASGAPYTGVQFFLSTVANANEQGLPISEFAKYKAAPNNYISDADRQAFVAVLKSAQFTTP